MTQNSVTIHQGNYSITIRIVNPPDSNIPEKQTPNQLISAEYLVRAAIKDVDKYDSVKASLCLNRLIQDSQSTFYLYIFYDSYWSVGRWIIQEFEKDEPYYRPSSRTANVGKPSDGFILRIAPTDHDDSVLIFEISSDDPLTNETISAVSLKEFLGDVTTTYFTSTVDELMNFLQTEDR